MRRQDHHPASSQITCCLTQVVFFSFSEIGHDHHLDQFSKCDLWFPSQDFASLGRVAEQLIDLGGAEIGRIHLDKDPYKGTSLNDLARHKEMPLSRQRLSECIRAAAVGAECESLGLNLESLTFYHKVELSRIKNSEVRVKLAQEAHEKSLTVMEVRDRVKKLTGKHVPADKRLAKSLIRQLREVARLTADDETREFLLDKDRLKEALDKGEIALLLDSSEDFRKASAESQGVLQQLETTLEEIVLERRQDGEGLPEQADTSAF